MSDDTKKPFTFGRRGLLKGLGAAASAAALPTLWLPRTAAAATPAFGTVQHLIYIRLGGGFRFTTAFNGDVADEFNPFGRSNSRDPSIGANGRPLTGLERQQGCNGYGAIMSGVCP